MSYLTAAMEAAALGDPLDIPPLAKAMVDGGQIGGCASGKRGAGDGRANAVFSGGAVRLSLVEANRIAGHLGAVLCPESYYG